jgi:hypothetical protein
MGAENRRGWAKYQYNNHFFGFFQANEFFFAVGDFHNHPPLTPSPQLLLTK